jgi:hypothetical protein
MDTETAGIREAVARIDERTETILGGMEEFKKALREHEDRDRMDFKELHHRVTSVERKQNWMLGIGTAVAFAAGSVLVWVRTTLGI